MSQGEKRERETETAEKPAPNPTEPYPEREWAKRMKEEIDRHVEKYLTFVNKVADEAAGNPLERARRLNVGALLLVKHGEFMQRTLMDILMEQPAVAKRFRLSASTE